jgi:molybdopterin converting factor small subunit
VFLQPIGELVTVEVRLPTLLRPAVGGHASVSIDGATVGDVLRALIAENPSLMGQVLTEDGSLHRFVNVYVNDDDVRYLDKLDTKLGEADVVSILPAVAGGAG